MVQIHLDSVSFKLAECRDFSWLAKYGSVFCVFAENDSGNISFGLDNGKEKRFVKVAGVRTTETVQSPADSVGLLKAAMPVYMDIRHPSLVELLDHYAHDDCYVAVFRWASGECLYDHWNFEKYGNTPERKSPATRFKDLSVEKRLQSLDTAFSFLLEVARCNYVAIDFYDGSILYDFDTDTTTICDIDLFRKAPTANDIGVEFWGTKRMKSPEEYVLGANLDEITNVFTLGAYVFGSFGSYSKAEYGWMYQNNAFFPCPREQWALDDRMYEVARRAVSTDRTKRYKSIADMYAAWNEIPFTA